MKNWKLIGRIATFSAIAATIFTVLQAVITYLILNLTTSGAPTEYIVYVILSTILPVLLIAVISLIVAVMSRGAKALEETPTTPEDEALPPAAPADVNA